MDFELANVRCKGGGERKRNKTQSCSDLFAYGGKFEICELSGIKDDGFYFAFPEEEWGKVFLSSFVASHDVLLYPTAPSSAAE